MSPVLVRVRVLVSGIGLKEWSVCIAPLMVWGCGGGGERCECEDDREE